MNYDFYNTGVYGKSNKLPETVEERSRKNERKRIMSMIRAYERNADRYSPKEVLKVQQLADMYDIPWSPDRPDPSFGQKALAFGGGIADTAMMDMIPDKWYTAKGTEGARELGAMLGIPVAVAAAMLSGGGTAALGAGAAGVRGAVGGAKGIAGLAKAIPGVGAGLGQMAGGAAGFLPGVAMAKAGVKGAQKVLAPMAQRFGVGTGTSFVKEGVRGAVRKTKREALQELRTLKGGVNNERAIELLKQGGFSPAEVKKYSSMVLRAPGGKAPKAMVNKMVTEVTGVAGGGKLSSGVITKLAQNAGRMKSITGSQAPKNVKRWVERSFGTTKTASEKKQIVDAILKSEHKTVNDLLIKGVTSGTKSVAPAVAPDYSGLAGLGIGAGTVLSGALSGTNTEVDPLRPYYDATVG
tara:strand:+ start:27168 stop:28397 length:1230 start_codon:yes stop_codon:yes gene_type:complete